MQGEELHAEGAEAVHLEELPKRKVGHFDSLHPTEERQLSVGRDDCRFVAQQMVEPLKEGLIFGGQSELKVSIVVDVVFVAVFFVELHRHFEDALSNFLFAEPNQTAFVELSPIQPKQIFFLFDCNSHLRCIADYLL